MRTDTYHVPPKGLEASRTLIMANITLRKVGNELHISMNFMSEPGEMDG
jgi:hypothetical protein